MLYELDKNAEAYNITLYVISPNISQVRWYLNNIGFIIKLCSNINHAINTEYSEIKNFLKPYLYSIFYHVGYLKKRVTLT